MALLDKACCWENVRTQGVEHNPDCVVLRERERLACLILEMKPEGGYTGNDWFRALREIAARIRSGQ